jgi:hypothetical protein
MDAKKSFVNEFLPHVRGLFRELILKYVAKPDHEFDALVNALREHEVTVFITELPREDRKICIDFNDEDSRRVARNELRRAPAPTHRRTEMPLNKRNVVEDLDAVCDILAYKWTENLLRDFPESVSAGQIYLNRNRIHRDANGMSDVEAHSWLMGMQLGLLEHCLFNMLRPHVTAYTLARIMRRGFYYDAIEATDAWKEFERNLEAIKERTVKRLEEVIPAAIERVLARY